MLSEFGFDTCAFGVYASTDPRFKGLFLQKIAEAPETWYCTNEEETHAGSGPTPLAALLSCVSHMQEDATESLDAARDKYITLTTLNDQLVKASWK
jgi:hypothetical protein